MVKKRSMYLIALGSNLSSEAGDSTRTVLAAIRFLGECGVEVEQVSRLFRTPAFPSGSGPDFVNAAARLRSGLGPRQMLDTLHTVERRLGRDRRRRWAPRTIDLDLLAAGDAVLPERDAWQAWADLPLDRQASDMPDRLILPHPRLQDRAFVLVPLAEVAGDWTHPVFGRSVAALLAELGPDAAEGVEPISLANPKNSH